MNDRDLDLKLTQALEAAPEVAIPPGFAARVAAMAPAAMAPAARFAADGLVAPRFAMWAVRAGLGLLLPTMLFFAQRSAGRSVVPLTVEMTLAAEFVLLTVWISLRPGLTR